MRDCVKFVLASVMLAGAALPAAAELKNKSEASVQAGGMLFEGDTDVETGFVYGARFGRFFTDKISAEVLLFGGNSDLDRKGSKAKAKVLYPAAGALYHFGSGKFMPFVQAGVGMLHLDPKGEATTNDVTVHWGGGVKYFWKPDLLVRLDITHMIDTKPGKGTNDLLGVLGVSWLLGASK